MKNEISKSFFRLKLVRHSIKEIYFLNETMLCGNSEQVENNSVIVSQITNPHTPQDFTVSRLLSTPTNSLGKNSGNLQTNYFI